MSAATAGTLTKAVSGPNERCASGALNLFSSAFIDYTINRVIDEVSYPVVPIQSETKLIECFIEPSKYYIDTSSMQASFELRILQSDGSAIPKVNPRPPATVKTMKIAKKRSFPSSTHAGTYWVPDSLEEEESLKKRRKMEEDTKEERRKKRKRESTEESEGAKKAKFESKVDRSPVPIVESRLSRSSYGPAVTFEGVNFDNAPGLLIWRDIDLKISGQSIQSCYGNFNLQSYILTLLFYSEDARKSKMEAFLWGDEDDQKCTDCVTPGNYKLRADLFGESAWVALRTPLPLSFHLQQRFCLPMTHLSYHLFLASADQVLKSAEPDMKFKFEIRNFKLHYNKIEVNESLALAIERRLSGAPAKYPLINFTTRDFIIPANLQVHTIDDIFSNVRIPSECYICFNTQEASLGTLTTSIIDFQNFGLIDACFYIDSVRYPSQELGISWDASTKRGALNAFAKLWSNSDAYQDEGK